MVTDAVERVPDQQVSWHTGLAYLLALSGPVLAWLVWISWNEDKASDDLHVLWFFTVAATCFLAGGFAPRGTKNFLALVAVSILSTITVLYLWWSSADVTGLFMIGIVLATPMVAIAAPVLLLLGRSWLPRLFTRSQSAPSKRQTNG